MARLQLELCALAGLTELPIMSAQGLQDTAATGAQPGVQGSINPRHTSGADMTYTQARQAAAAAAEAAAAAVDQERLAGPRVQLNLAVNPHITDGSEGLSGKAASSNAAMLSRTPTRRWVATTGVRHARGHTAQRRALDTLSCARCLHVVIFPPPQQTSLLPGCRLGAAKSVRVLLEDMQALSELAQGLGDGALAVALASASPAQVNTPTDGDSPVQHASSGCPSLSLGSCLGGKAAGLGDALELGEGDEQEPDMDAMRALASNTAALAVMARARGAEDVSAAAAATLDQMRLWLVRGWGHHATDE